GSRPGQDAERGGSGLAGGDGEDRRRGAEGCQALHLPDAEGSRLEQVRRARRDVGAGRRELPAQGQVTGEQAGADGDLIGVQAIADQVIEVMTVLELVEDLLNGVITNDKFCLTRQGHLQLTWWRFPLRRRGEAARRDVAAPVEAAQRGGSDETAM